jgi:hypothetical protein
VTFTEASQFASADRPVDYAYEGALDRVEGSGSPAWLTPNGVEFSVRTSEGSVPAALADADGLTLAFEGSDLRGPEQSLWSGAMTESRAALRDSASGRLLYAEANGYSFDEGVQFAGVEVRWRPKCEFTGAVSCYPVARRTDYVADVHADELVSVEPGLPQTIQINGAPYRVFLDVAYDIEPMSKWACADGGGGGGYSIRIVPGSGS